MTDKNKIVLDTQQITTPLKELQGELSARIFGLPEGDRFSCQAPLTYNLRASLVGEGFLVEGQAGSIVHCSCDRCLKDYDVQVTASSICHYYEGLENRVIDLTDDVREDVIISFPDKCLCNEKCKGLCQTCGQNLNDGTCDCTGRDKFPNAWDKLDGLDL